MSTVAERNKAFEKLSAAKKRVAIAVDVLKQIETGKLIPTSSIYCEAPKRIRVHQLDQDLSKTFEEIETCNVCGLGGLFVSAVMNADELKTEHATFGSTKIDISGGQIRQYLDKFFSATQLNKIETAFERSTGFGGGRVAEQFAFNINDPSLRMQLIMQNIIVHNGTFHPENRPVQKWTQKWTIEEFEEW